ncbi:(Fe-S)-binding protein [Pontibacter sp. G13]|uniref:(Fe-S)-binding protein n=1 Tax=Pontibacter sp. G13 TaxID=3074898 RepID=UPI0028892EED|nr:(Fe-S)-binding protein [Pontibacter sp. G13]WNJ21351.1 (Fe-S)-binding protein [Pontibacter sp. G13]
MISQILFLLVTAAAAGLFAFQLRKVRQNIQLGRPLDRSDQPGERWKTMALVAFGQQKMFKRFTPAFLHAIVYVSFLVINIEVLEIVIDGIFGSHRILGQFSGPLYDVLMVVNEWLALLVIVACVIFMIRRNILKVKRFDGVEMEESKGTITRRNYSHLDANIILVTEIVLMAALFAFNVADIQLHALGAGALQSIDNLPGTFPVSSIFADMQLFGTNPHTLHLIERIGWWGHIVGIFLFLNYLPISKHFHIIMAFPNTYFSKLEPKGELDSPKNIHEEVKAAFDFNYQPVEDPNGPKRFGAKDITDLTWKSLMDAYTCTECGRCTSVCPANTTGKKLSPRKIVMDVRDRMEEASKYKLVPNEEGLLVPSDDSIEGAAEAAQHTLLGEHYITNEELLACTTCNACTEACPVNIDQVTIITEMRRYLIMEESSMPEEWGIMTQNIENNGAPWAMPAADRFNWAMDIDKIESNEKVSE